MAIKSGLLHHTIIKFILDNGYAPELHELAGHFDTTENSIVKALRELQQHHGIVLHPRSSKVWVIHPFSLAPTNFVVRCRELEWWGNCAWCSLGIAALLDEAVTITTTLGANGEQVNVNIKDGQVLENDLVVHFPIPMREAWNNVIYTCSTMLLFKNHTQIDGWCKKHRIGKGDVQPISTVWQFARVWYGNHLNPDWKKWTVAEAKAIFAQFDLKGDIWDIPLSDSRF